MDKGRPYEFDDDLLFELTSLPKGSGRPTKDLIADVLRTAIQTRRIAQGKKLPSPSAIARRYQVGRYTADQAILILEREGLVQRTSGYGNWVRGPKLYPGRPTGEQ